MGEKVGHDESNREDAEQKKDEGMDVDEILTAAGGFGRFQGIMLLVFVYLVLTIGQHFVSSVFIGPDPPWTCTNITMKNQTGNHTNEFCKKYPDRHVASDSDDFKLRCKWDTSEWEYTTKRDYSFVTEFDLVCSKSGVAALAASAVYMGGMLGSSVAGPASDAYGRKPVLLVSLLLTFVFSLLCAFIKEIWQLTLLRVLLGAASVSCYFTAFVTLSEFVTPSSRTMASNMYIMSLTCSHMLFDLWAYYQRKWRLLQMHSSFTCLLAFAILIFMPESPRWLVATKRDDRAKEILNKVARVNGRSLGTIKLKQMTSPPTANAGVKKYSYLDLVRSPKVLFVTFCIGIVWFTIGLVYYAIVLEAASLGGDMYATFALTALADMPSFFTSAYTCDKFGRKTSNLVSLFIAGILVGGIAAVPQTLKHATRYAVNMTLVMIAKFFAENAFNGIYTWSFEVFPTVLRSQGIAVCVIFQRFGLLVVPFLTTVLQSVSYVLPFIFMCVLAILCCLLGLTLPETNKKPTREAYEDFFEKKSPNVKGTVNEGVASSDV